MQLCMRLTVLPASDVFPALVCALLCSGKAAASARQKRRPAAQGGRANPKRSARTHDATDDAHGGSDGDKHADGAAGDDDTSSSDSDDGALQQRRNNGKGKAKVSKGAAAVYDTLGAIVSALQLLQVSGISKTSASVLSVLAGYISLGLLSLGLLRCFMVYSALMLLLPNSPFAIGMAAYTPVLAMSSHCYMSLWFTGCAFCWLSAARPAS